MRPRLEVSQVVGDQVRVERARRRMNQEAVAQHMRLLAFDTWSRATVSEIECGRRAVTVDELAGLAIVLSTSTAVLLGSLESAEDHDAARKIALHWARGSLSEAG